MSTHIRFLCPACQAVMEAPVGRAGDKIHCLNCGQRIQIPPAERAKTILAPALNPQDYRQPAPAPAPLLESSDRLWHYSRGGKQAGPLSTAALKQMASSGQLAPTDMVWTPGMASWAPAETIKGLFTTPATGSTVSSITGATLPGVPATALGDPRGPLATPAAYPGAPRPRLRVKVQMSVWTYLLFAGAGLMFLAFVTPWWSLKEYSDRDAGYSEVARRSEAGRRFMADIKRNAPWYLEHFGPGIALTGFSQGTLWSWNTGPGVLSFIACILVSALTLVPLLVPSIARWAWIGAFVSAVLSFLVFLLSMIWFLRAPGESMPGVVSQGCMIGIWLSIIGGFLALIGGILGGIPGLRSFNANEPDDPMLLPIEELCGSAVASPRSSSRLNLNAPDPIADRYADAPPLLPERKRHTGLIIGLSIGGVLLVAVILVFILSRGGLKSQIIGRWELTDRGKRVYLLEFKSDGSFAGEFEGGGGRVDKRTGETVELTSVQTFRGTFSIAGDVLLLHPIEWGESGFDRRSGDAKGLKTLEFTVKIKGDTMTLTAPDKRKLLRKSLNSVAFTRVR